MKVGILLTGFKTLWEEEREKNPLVPRITIVAVTWFKAAGKRRSLNK